MLRQNLNIQIFCAFRGETWGDFWSRAGCVLDKTLKKVHADKFTWKTHAQLIPLCMLWFGLHWFWGSAVQSVVFFKDSDCPSEDLLRFPFMCKALFQQGLGGQTGGARRPVTCQLSKYDGNTVGRGEGTRNHLLEV